MHYWVLGRTNPVNIIFQTTRYTKAHFCNQIKYNFSFNGKLWKYQRTIYFFLSFFLSFFFWYDILLPTISKCTLESQRSFMNKGRHMKFRFYAEIPTKTINRSKLEIPTHITRYFIQIQANTVILYLVNGAH